MNNDPQYPGAGPAANYHQPMPNTAHQGNQYGMPPYGYQHQMGKINNRIGYNMHQNMYSPQNHGQYPGLMDPYAQPHTFNHGVNAPPVEGQMGRHAMNDGTSSQMGNFSQNHVEGQGIGPNDFLFSDEMRMSQSIKPNNWQFNTAPVGQPRMMENQLNDQRYQNHSAFNGPGAQNFPQHQYMNGYGQQAHPSQHHQHPPVPAASTGWHQHQQRNAWDQVPLGSTQHHQQTLPPGQAHPSSSINHLELQNQQTGQHATGYASMDSNALNSTGVMRKTDLRQHQMEGRHVMTAEEAEREKRKNEEIVMDQRNAWQSKKINSSKQAVVQSTTLSGMQMHTQHQYPFMPSQRMHPVNQVHPSYMHLAQQPAHLPVTKVDPPLKQPKEKKPNGAATTTANKCETPKKKEKEASVQQTPTMQNFSFPIQSFGHLYGSMSHPQSVMQPNTVPETSAEQSEYSQPVHPPMNEMQQNPQEQAWHQQTFNNPLEDLYVQNNYYIDVNTEYYSPASLQEENLNPSIGSLTPGRQLSSAMSNASVTQLPTTQPTIVSPSNMLTPSTSNSGSMPTSMEQVPFNQTPLSAEVQDIQNPKLSPEVNRFLDRAVELLLGKTSRDKPTTPNSEVQCNRPSDSGKILHNAEATENAAQIASLAQSAPPLALSDGLEPTTSPPERVQNLENSVIGQQLMTDNSDINDEQFSKMPSFLTEESKVIPSNTYEDSDEQFSSTLTNSMDDYFETPPVENILPSIVDVSKSVNECMETNDNLYEEVDEYFPNLRQDNKSLKSKGETQLPIDELVNVNATNTATNTSIYGKVSEPLNVIPHSEYLNSDTSLNTNESALTEMIENNLATEHAVSDIASSSYFYENQFQLVQNEDSNINRRSIPEQVNVQVAPQETELTGATQIPANEIFDYSLNDGSAETPIEVLDACIEEVSMNQDSVAAHFNELDAVKMLSDNCMTEPLTVADSTEDVHATKVLEIPVEDALAHVEELNAEMQLSGDHASDVVLATDATEAVDVPVTDVSEACTSLEDIPSDVNEIISDKQHSDDHTAETVTFAEKTTYSDNCTEEVTETSDPQVHNVGGIMEVQTEMQSDGHHEATPATGIHSTEDVDVHAKTDVSETLDSVEDSLAKINELNSESTLSHITDVATIIESNKKVDVHDSKTTNSVLDIVDETNDVKEGTLVFDDQTRDNVAATKKAEQTDDCAENVLETAVADTTDNIDVHNVSQSLSDCEIHSLMAVMNVNNDTVSENIKSDKEITFENPNEIETKVAETSCSTELKKETDLSLHESNDLEVDEKLNSIQSDSTNLATSLRPSEHPEAIETDIKPHSRDQATSMKTVEEKVAHRQIRNAGKPVKSSFLPVFPVSEKKIEVPAPRSAALTSLKQKLVEYKAISADTNGSTPITRPSGKSLTLPTNRKRHYSKTDEQLYIDTKLELSQSIPAGEHIYSPTLQMELAMTHLNTIVHADRYIPPTSRSSLSPVFEPKDLCIHNSPMSPENIYRISKDSAVEIPLVCLEEAFAFDSSPIEKQEVNPENKPLEVSPTNETRVSEQVSNLQIISPNSIPHIPLPPAPELFDEILTDNISDDEKDESDKPLSMSPKFETEERPLSLESATETTGSPIVENVEMSDSKNTDDGLILEDISDSDNDENSDIKSTFTEASIEEEKGEEFMFSEYVTEDKNAEISQCDEADDVEPSENIWRHVINPFVDKHQQESKLVKTDLDDFVDTACNDNRALEVPQVANFVLDSIPLPQEPHPNDDLSNVDIEKEQGNDLTSVGIDEPEVLNKGDVNTIGNNVLASELGDKLLTTFSVDTWKQLDNSSTLENIERNETTANVINLFESVPVSTQFGVIPVEEQITKQKDEEQSPDEQEEVSFSPVTLESVKVESVLLEVNHQDDKKEEKTLIETDIQVRDENVISISRTTDNACNDPIDDVADIPLPTELETFSVDSPAVVNDMSTETEKDEDKVEAKNEELICTASSAAVDCDVNLFGVLESSLHQNYTDSIEVEENDDASGTEMIVEPANSSMIDKEEVLKNGADKDDAFVNTSESVSQNVSDVNTIKTESEHAPSDLDLEDEEAVPHDDLEERSLVEVLKQFETNATKNPISDSFDVALSTAPISVDKPNLCDVSIKSSRTDEEIEEVNATMESLLADVCEICETTSVKSDTILSTISQVSTSEECELSSSIVQGIVNALSPVLNETKSDLKSYEVEVPKASIRTVSERMKDPFNIEGMRKKYYEIAQEFPENPNVKTKCWEPLHKRLRKEGRDSENRLFKEMKNNLTPSEPFLDEVTEAMDMMLRYTVEEATRQRIFKRSCENARIRKKYHCDPARTTEMVAPAKRSRKRKGGDKIADDENTEFKSKADAEQNDMKIVELLGFSPAEICKDFLSCTYFFSNFTSLMIPRIFDTVSAPPSYVTEPVEHRYPTKRDRIADETGPLSELVSADACLKKYELAIIKEAEKDDAERDVPALYSFEASCAHLQGAKKPVANHELNELRKVMSNCEANDFRGCIKVNRMTKTQNFYLYVALLTFAHMDKGFQHKDLAFLIFECSTHLCRLGAFGTEKEIMELLPKAKLALVTMQPNYGIANSCSDAYNSLRKSLKTIYRGLSLPVLKWMFKTVVKNYKVEGETPMPIRDPLQSLNHDKMLSERVKSMIQSGNSENDFDYYDEYADLRVNVHMPPSLSFFTTYDRRQYFPFVHLLMNTRSRSWIVSHHLRMLREALSNDFIKEANKLGIEASAFGESTRDPKFALINEDHVHHSIMSEKLSMRQKEKNREKREAEEKQARAEEARIAAVKAVKKGKAAPTSKTASVSSTDNTVPKRRGRPPASAAASTEQPDSDEPAPKRRGRQPATRSNNAVADPVYEIESEVATSSRGRTRNVTRTWSTGRPKTKKPNPETEAPVVEEEPEPTPVQPARRGRKRVQPAEEVPEENEPGPSDRRKRSRRGRNEDVEVEVEPQVGVEETEETEGTEENKETDEKERKEEEEEDEGEEEEMEHLIATCGVETTAEQLARPIPIDAIETQTYSPSLNPLQQQEKRYYAMEFAPRRYYFFRIALATKNVPIRRYAKYVDSNFNAPVRYKKGTAPKIAYMTLPECWEMVVRTEHPYKERFIVFFDTMEDLMMRIERDNLYDLPQIITEPLRPKYKRGRKRGSTMYFPDSSGRYTIRAPEEEEPENEN